MKESRHVFFSDEARQELINETGVRLTKETLWIELLHSVDTPAGGSCEITWNVEKDPTKNGKTKYTIYGVIRELKNEM